MFWILNMHKFPPDVQLPAYHIDVKVFFFLKFERTLWLVLYQSPMRTTKSSAGGANGEGIILRGLMRMLPKPPAAFWNNKEG